jgi:hypothetical protein
VEKILLKHDPTATICHFFFKDAVAQGELTSALCSILHQLFLSNRSLLGHCEHQIRAAGPMLSSDSTGLWGVFKDAINCPEAGQVICVFDALDECDRRGFEKLLRIIRNFLMDNSSREQNSQIKFLITARGYPYILSEFEDFGSSYTHLSLSDDYAGGRALQQEINLVVGYRLDRLSTKKELKDVRKNLIRKALVQQGSEQRTYLWVKLVFDLLDNNDIDTSEEWERLAKNPPDTVFTVYETLLAQVAPCDIPKVEVLLHLVAAAKRPLTLEEMNVAIYVRKFIGVYSKADIDMPGENNFRN